MQQEFSIYLLQSEEFQNGYTQVRALIYQIQIEEITQIASPRGDQTGRAEQIGDMTALLEETVLMMQAVELFDNFIHNKERVRFVPLHSLSATQTALAALHKAAEEACGPILEQSTTIPAIDWSAPPADYKLLVCSALNRRSQELTGKYLLLEEVHIF